VSRIPEPFVIRQRKDCKTYLFSLNPTCGLPERICREWQRKSFQTLPDELAHHRKPKNKPHARIAVQALIGYLNKKQEEGSSRRVIAEDITVGKWIKKFTEMETGPRTGINTSKNRPSSYDTLDGYKGSYERYIKDDPICDLKMAEVEEEDILEYTTRLSLKKTKDGRQIGGTRTFVLVIVFMRMTFNEYQRINRRPSNPFQYIPVPKSNQRPWDALTEEEVLKLFMPGVLQDVLELVVCAVLFLSGLRRAEVPALMPEDLDWKTPKILVCRVGKDSTLKIKRWDQAKEKG
jgi:integrase